MIQRSNHDQSPQASQLPFIERAVARVGHGTDFVRLESLQSERLRWISLGNGDCDNRDLDGLVLFREGEQEDQEGVPGPLPLISEEGLEDPARLGCFLERVFCHARWKAFVDSSLPLSWFHARHASLILAMDEAAPSGLSSISREADADLTEYGRRLAALISAPISREGHVRALRYLLSRVRPCLNARDRRTMRLAIEDYRRGALPLTAPRSILRHHVERSGGPSLASDFYAQAPHLPIDGEPRP